MNLYGFVSNRPLDRVDFLGMWETDVHHDIVDSWLADERYIYYQIKCCRIKVRALIKDGSDAVDGAGGHWVNFLSAQASSTSYQHGMKSPKQSKQDAERQFHEFIDDAIGVARGLGTRARTDNVRRDYMSSPCTDIENAVRELGRAFHAISDSYSPSHVGFQTWYGPIDGALEFGGYDYFADYVAKHKAGETMERYQSMKPGVVAGVKAQLQAALDDILRE